MKRDGGLICIGMSPGRGALAQLLGLGLSRCRKEGQQGRQGSAWWLKGGGCLVLQGMRHIHRHSAAKCRVCGVNQVNSLLTMLHLGWGRRLWGRARWFGGVLMGDVLGRWAVTGWEGK